jgi:hypothetical protein
MADGAHREVLAAHPGRIEARTMRIESAAAHRRVAGQAIAFRVTTDARLEALARCLTVSGQEKLPRVMIPGPEHSGRD